MNNQDESSLTRLLKNELLSFDDEIDLAVKARNGCVASKQKLIESNIRLVISIAKGYNSPHTEDLIQEGILGLAKAVERFDPERGFRFSTYATHWIRQSIGRAIDNKSKQIRLPAHVSQTIRKVEKFKAKYLKEHNREPSLYEIEAELGVSVKKLHTMMVAAQETLSLDAHISQHDNTTFEALLGDSNCIDPEEAASAKEMFAKVLKLVENLTTREQLVALPRLQATDSDLSVMRESLAKELSISRERLRQIELQAMRKLRKALTRTHSTE